ncbi:MAG: heavy metal translocating P-type ATPase [Burkholderiaceae bacterium]|nr:heavy metal translocating P-type ATPase [Burkholderiaceae bacterium]
MSKHCCPPEPAARPARGHDHAPAHDHDHDHGEAGGSGHLHDHSNLPGWPRLIAALAVAVAAELFHFFAPDTQVWHVAGMALAAVAIVLAGLDIYRSGLTSLARGRLDINALMTVAVTGAFLIGQWPEAAMVMALYAIAELIEDKAADRARGAIAGLMALSPDTADVQGADGTWTALPVADVQPGALVRVRPGGRIPLDGEVARGTSAVNQAPVTGESIPVDKAAGDPVFAGTISETGELLVRTTAVAGQSTLARIIAAVEQAQATRAPTQRFVDRFAAVYTPAVFAIALAVAVLGPFVAGWTWLDAIYKALVLLVIACPCALVISTPVTVVSGLTAAARRGILIKGGTFLESARKLRAVALDKTGTLTQGQPKLVTWQAWAGADAAQARHAAASLAARSDHPVSRAIAQGLADEAEATAALADVQDFQALAGRGSAGRIDASEWLLGNHRLIEERALCSPELEATLATHEAEGRTVTLLAGPQGVAAVFAVADTLRPTSRQAVEELKAMGIVPVMLSGDNTATAQAVARAAGIDEAQGNLLPEDKQRVLAGLQQRHGPTAMTGDGINDAPALAAADLGFAMGGAGTDIAMESADVVVMNDDLRRLPETVRLSRRTHAVLWQNISLALGIKVVFFVMALFGEATMWMAVFADMGASLLVVGNGLRLLKADVTR